MKLIDDRDVQIAVAAAKHNQGAVITPEFAIGDPTEKAICKTDILYQVSQSYKSEQAAQKQKELDTKWIQRLTNKTKGLQRGIDSFLRFTEEEAIFLRFSECVRKYALESELLELGLDASSIWPWYRNTFHSADNKYRDNENYNELMVRYNLVFDDMREFLRNNLKVVRKCKILVGKKWTDAEIISVILDENGAEVLEIQYLAADNAQLVTEKVNRNQIKTAAEPIRHKRKFAAKQLLNAADTERNLNIMKHQIALCFEGLDKALKALNKEEENDKSSKMIYKRQLELTDEGSMLTEIQKYIKTYIDTGKLSWKLMIKTINEKYKNQFEDKCNEYTLFEQHLENLKTIDITKCKLPLFEQFVFELFVAADKKTYDRNSCAFKDIEEYFYRMWIEDWRDVPDWYTYYHDVLLLELVMRNGINVDYIMDDLNGEKSIEYKLRLNVDKTKINEMSVDDSYYLFNDWCRKRINVLHRLKYVTNIIVRNLQSEPYRPSLIDIRIAKKADRPIFDGKSLIFSDYECEAHLQFMKRSPTKLTHSDQFDADGIVAEKPALRALKQMSSTDTEIVTEEPLIGQRIDAHISDPFLCRNIDEELFGALQSFDLMTYGKPLALFIIDRLKQGPGETDSLFKVLDILFDVLPYPVAKDCIDSAKDFFQYMPPDKLYEICLNVVTGSQISRFQPSAALDIAGFFDDLAEHEIVRCQEWTDIAQQFEEMASDELHKLESNHLLFMHLTVPIATQQGKSLVQLALEQRRLGFLNSERIWNIMQHQYRAGFLTPHTELQKQFESYELLKGVLFTPFKFYHTAQGYHWTQVILFMLYLIFVYVYASFRPLSGELDSAQMVALEVILWSCNFGYIVYEVFEMKDKTPARYFNLGVKGQTNLMDVVISVFWIILGVIRAYLIINKTPFEQGDTATPIQSFYVLLFAFEIALLTLRSLNLFSNTEYLGRMLKVIKLMIIEIGKFLFIYVISMVGFLFGIWFISLTNEGSGDFEVDNIWDGLKYVFQVFLGNADLGGVGDQTIGIIFMVAATFFGTLILTNLLIALMATEYDRMMEQAQKEVVFNQTELTFDLSTRLRLMPPPLNIIVIAFCFVAWCFNCFFSVIHPKLNIYAYLNNHSFNILLGQHYGWPVFVTIILWIILIIGISVNDETGFVIAMITAALMVCFWIVFLIYVFREGTKPIKHFQFMARKELCKLYCGCGKQENDKKNIGKVHHRICFAELRVSTKSRQHAPVNGITMTRYIDEYESKHSAINADDKSVLKQLTTNTLFCSKCYKPFSNQKEAIDEELASPFDALLEFCSGITFVFIPLAWLPLVMLFLVFTAIDWIKQRFQDNSGTDQNYTNQQFDAGYFDREQGQN